MTAATDILPHDPFGFASLVTLVLSGWGAVLFQGRRQGRRLNDVHEQVHNKHETNLRDDLDDIASAVNRLSDRLDRHIEQCWR